MLFDVSDDVPSADQPTNVFLALMPPQAVARQFYSDAATLCRSARIVGSQRPPEILHVTLLPIGAVPGRIPRALLKAIDTSLRMVWFPSFDMLLDEARSFDTRKDAVPVVLESIDLTPVVALRLALKSALEVRDFPVRSQRAYRPHMTIAYARRRSPRIQVTPFCWRATEVVLIESWSGMTKYVKLGAWQLGGEAPIRPLVAPARPTLGDGCRFELA